MSFICHIHNYTEYNEEWNVFSAFNPSKCTHLKQWAANCAAPGEQSWTSCRSRDSNPQPWVTSGFKSNALSIRPTRQDHRNQMSPLHNLTLLQPRFKLLILSGQRRKTLFRHTISPSKYCKDDINTSSFISGWCKAALTSFALLKALNK